MARPRKPAQDKKCKCICCGCSLKNFASKGFQPIGGLALHSYGHYGADFDPMDGTSIEVVVCNACMAKAETYTYNAEALRNG